MKILLALALLLGSVSVSQAASVANDGTCAAAQATYAANGRIYVRANGRDIVPIYGLVARSNDCPAGFDGSPYWIRTVDTGSCVIGFRCYEDDNGNN